MYGSDSLRGDRGVRLEDYQSLGQPDREALGFARSAHPTGRCCESPLASILLPATRLFLFGQEAIDGGLEPSIGLGSCYPPESFDLAIVGLGHP